MIYIGVVFNNINQNKVYFFYKIWNSNYLSFTFLKKNCLNFHQYYYSFENKCELIVLSKDHQYSNKVDKNNSFPLL